MKTSDILPGRVYEAKIPQPVQGRGRFFDGKPLVNDRLVLWVNRLRTRVQWDGPACKTQGGKPEVIDMDRFLRWAGREITAIMPDGEWRPWIESQQRVES